jgi:hypothetical protein
MARKHEDWFRGDDIRRAQESYKQAGENRVLRLAASVILLGHLLRDTNPLVLALSSGFSRLIISRLTLTLL